MALVNDQPQALAHIPACNYICYDHCQPDAENVVGLHKPVWSATVLTGGPNMIVRLGIRGQPHSRLALGGIVSLFGAKRDSSTVEILSLSRGVMV